MAAHFIAMMLAEIDAGDRFDLRDKFVPHSVTYNHRGGVDDVVAHDTDGRAVRCQATTYMNLSKKGKLPAAIKQVIADSKSEGATPDDVYIFAVSSTAPATITHCLRQTLNKVRNYSDSAAARRQLSHEKLKALNTVVELFGADDSSTWSLIQRLHVLNRDFTPGGPGRNEYLADLGRSLVHPADESNADAAIRGLIAQESGSSHHKRFHVVAKLRMAGVRLENQPSLAKTLD